jgi:pyruvate formate lyase activating enzyme
MKEAMLWKIKKINDKEVICCNICARRCFIPEGKRGFCQLRENIKGKLFTLNFGKVVGLHFDPIEKKPLYHFYPGSEALSYACRGCNWRCVYCCNWEISHDGLPEIFGEDYTPEQIVNIAISSNCKIISHTYTEPTVFYEFAYEVAKLAHRKKIKNTFVTNGYMTPEALKKIAKYLDAATVDFKASNDKEFLNKFASVPDGSPIFDFLLGLKKHKIHFEITDLIVPKIGDKIEEFRKLVKWIVENLGEETPFHLIRFFPSYKLLDLPPTPVVTLEKFAAEAKKLGLVYVYVGNIPGHRLENTYCPNCNSLLIERMGFRARAINLEANKCKICGKKIKVII